MCICVIYVCVCACVYIFKCVLKIFRRIVVIFFGRVVLVVFREGKNDVDGDRSVVLGLYYISR